MTILLLVPYLAKGEESPKFHPWPELGLTTSDSNSSWFEIETQHNTISALVASCVVVIRITIINTPL